MTRRGLTDRTIAQMLEEVSATNIYLFKIKSWKLKLKVKKLFYCIQILCHPYFFWLVPRPALNFCRMRIRNNYSGSGKKIRVRPDPDHHPCSKLPMLLQIFCYSDKKKGQIRNLSIISVLWNRNVLVPDPHPCSYGFAWLGPVHCVLFPGIKYLLLLFFRTIWRRTARIMMMMPCRLKLMISPKLRYIT